VESLLRLGQRSVGRRRGDGRPLPGPAGVAASTLTKESAQLASKYGLRKSSTTGLSTGVLKGSSGQVKGFVQFVRGRGSLLASPALLAGAAGIMAQVAMQQTMDEIIDYLATIGCSVRCHAIGAPAQ
jgi:hypothetical protein